MIIEGAIAVKAAVGQDKREVKKVFMEKGKNTKDFNYLRRIVKQKNIELIEMDRTYLENLASGKTFGGVLAEVGARKNDELSEGDVFYIDGVEDPFNLGYMMRNLYAFGIKNVILPMRDYSFMEAQLLKSSAGASEHLNICVADNPSNLIKQLKNQGYKNYALYRGDEAKDIFDTKFSSPAIFMIGGEKRGIGSALLELADENLYISYGSDFRNALNACNALAVVATLLFNQRRK